jgi:hypothetical protein
LVRKHKLGFTQSPYKHFDLTIYDIKIFYFSGLRDNYTKYLYIIKYSHYISRSILNFSEYFSEVFNSKEHYCGGEIISIEKEISICLLKPGLE